MICTPLDPGKRGFAGDPDPILHWEGRSGLVPRQPAASGGPEYDILAISVRSGRASPGPKFIPGRVKQAKIRL